MCFRLFLCVFMCFTTKHIYVTSQVSFAKHATVFEKFEGTALTMQWLCNIDKSLWHNIKLCLFNNGQHKNVKKKKKS